MSLISIHNLVAPLGNKTNLVSVILVALLFGIFRVSGGGFDSGEAPRRKPPQAANAARQAAAPEAAAIPNDADLDRELDATAARIADDEGDPALEAMLGRSGNEKPKDVEPQAGTGDSLSELEKSLGLR